MHVRTLAGCLGLLTALAGCAGAPDGPADPGAEGGTESGLPSMDGEVSLEPRTLASPPAWQLGEWWRVRVTEQFQGTTIETLRVVAGVEGDSYLVGMPRDEFRTDLMVLHIPGFGQVDRFDLGFEIHDVLFSPLQFPLTTGLSFDTAFEGRPVQANVTVESETTATVEFTGANDHLVATYDTAIGEVSRLVIDNYATVEVVEHGFNHSGIVTVPHMHDLVFFHGRIAGALSPSLLPAGPTESVNIDPTYDRLSFVLAVGGLNPQDPVVGVFRETATAPDGTVYEIMKTSADGPGWGTQFFMHDSPGGEWQLEHIAGGPGIAFIEGIAYHVYEVQLPGGCILPAEGEHPHGGAC